MERQAAAPFIGRELESLQGQNPGEDYEFRQVVRDLRDALRLLQDNRPRMAADQIGRAAYTMRRSQNFRLRREIVNTETAQNLALRGRADRAARMVRTVLSNLRQGGGPPPPPQDPDYANRAEWRRDIRDLITQQENPSDAPLLFSNVARM